MNNNVTVSGRLAEDFQFSHETRNGEKFYSSSLISTRVSGTIDLIPILISERLLINITAGDFVNIVGEFRSHNKQVDGRSKLLLYIFVKNLFIPTDEVEYNEVRLIAFICKPPKYRTTPNNRVISDLLLAVNRNYNKSDYIPCIAWGTNAKYVSELPVGTEISLIGRIQSREYTKKIGEENETRVAYEVSISVVSTDRVIDIEPELKVFDKGDDTELFKKAKEYDDNMSNYSDSFGSELDENLKAIAVDDMFSSESDEDMFSVHIFDDIEED